MTYALLNSLWRASWQGAVVVAALWCFCRVFEVRRWLSADLRCWLWRGAYIKLLLGLVVAARVALPLLPPVAPVASVVETPKLSRGEERAAFVPAPLSPTERPVSSAAVRGEKINGSVVPWRSALAALYLLGVGVCVFRVGQKGLATRRLLKEAAAKPADANDAETTAEIARLALLFGLRRAPRLLRSPNISIPAYAARTVLLPTATNYTAQETRLVLAHELAHARRCDLVWEWLGTVAQIVFFFHPLIWLARREERLCREAAADMLALRVTQARTADYGKLLLRFSLARAGEPLAGVVGIVDRGTLFRRRLLCLGENASMTGSVHSVRSWKRWANSAALVFSVSAFLFIPWSLQARAQKTASPQTQNVSANPQLAAEKRKMDRALSNAKQLGLACLMCAADNNAVFKISPATFRKDIGGYLKNNRMDVNAFTSPLDKPGTQSFVFNDALKNMPQKKIISTQNIVMVYEGAWGKPRFRYHGVALIVFADGHAKFIRPSQAKDLIWEPQAQAQNTPTQAPKNMAKEQEAFKAWVATYKGRWSPAPTTVKKENVYKQAFLNAKHLGLACLMQAYDNDCYKINPATFRRDVDPYIPDRNIFTSPLDKPGTQSFQFNKDLQNVAQKKLKNANRIVMVYEGAWGKPLFRYNGAAIVVFADGHVAPVAPAQAKDLVWKP